MIVRPLMKMIDENEIDEFDENDSHRLMKMTPIDVVNIEIGSVGDN